MRSSPRRFALVGWCAALVGLVAVACSSSSGNVGAGGACQVATDCADGLVCIPQKDGSRVCSSDLTGVQKAPPTTATDAGARGNGDASGADDSTAPTEDAPSSEPDATGD